MSFYVKQNDLSPSILVTLYDGDGVVQDITGNLGVRFHMRDAAGTTKIDAAMTVVSAGDGQVRYDWVSGDTDTVGVYQAEVEVTYADSKPETFPNFGYITVTIDDDIA